MVDGGTVKRNSICSKEIEKSLGWIYVESVENEMAKLMYKPQLHEGEVGVMILAEEMAADFAPLSCVNCKDLIHFLIINQCNVLRRNP